ncbi:hypothetical protein L917_17381 [Phytophthora nicotianae]|uniref:Uncharacterized protein n=2 Tax=Phytophthora nicotianae TaxID=4792 RepID=V9EAM7_PHYNI|nr:hypothetical protein F443_18096 [Phytophthora nicotianae P1569]ETL82450.1 hypothetical protein L917_17381 [Phytophthora nicotianae]
MVHIPINNGFNTDDNGFIGDEPATRAAAVVVSSDPTTDTPSQQQVASTVQLPAAPARQVEMTSMVSGQGPANTKTNSDANDNDDSAIRSAGWSNRDGTSSASNFATAADDTIYGGNGRSPSASTGCNVESGPSDGSAAPGTSVAFCITAGSSGST